MRRFAIAIALTAGLALSQPPNVKHAARQPASKSVTSKASALDKATFEAYVRHLFVWPQPIQVSVGDPQPSELPGFEEVTVHAESGNAKQDEKFFISKNGQKIVRGMIYDVAKNPFQPDLAKLNVEHQPQIGTQGASVAMVEFSDFECSYCRQQAKTLRENLLAAYPKDVHLYYLDFPLETIHPWAHAAALAGRCVYHQSEAQFWEFHDWIFEHQAEIKTVDDLHSRVHDWAEAQHLDQPKLEACQAAPATEAEVQRTIALGKRVNVGSTPTMFVNGRPLVGAVNWPELRRVIDYEIGYQQTAKNAGEACGCDAGLAKIGVK